MTSKFLKVKCDKCNNEQNVFGSASTEVKCTVCGNVLLKPKGGRAGIETKISKVLD